MRYILTITAFVIYLLGPHAALGKSAGYDFKSGNWSGKAYTNDSDQVFTHCAMVGSYRNGITLVFSILSNSSISIGLHNKSWNVKAGSTFNITLSIDSIYAGSFNSYAIKPRLIRIDIGNNLILFNQLRRGRNLIISATKEKFEFALTGTNIALGKLLNCVRLAKVGLAKSENPSSTSSTNPFTDENYAQLPTIAPPKRDSAAPLGSLPDFRNTNVRSKPLTSKISASDLSKAAKFFTEYSRAYNELMAAMTVIGELDDLTLSLEQEEVTSDYAKQKQRELKIKYATIMMEYNSLFPRIKISKYTSKVFTELTKSTISYIPSLKQDLELMYVEGENYINQVILGNDIDINHFYARRLSRYVKIMESENVLMRGSIISAKTSHPQYHLTSIVVFANEYLITILSTAVNIFETGSTEQLSQLEDANVQLRKAYSALEVGRANNKKTFIGTKKIAKRKGLTELYKEAQENYSQSFDVEEAILNLLKGLSAEGFQSDDAWDKLEMVDPLVTRRLRLQEERASILGKSAEVFK
jgi:hypothetical protein